MVIAVNLSSWKEEACKKIRASTEFEPMTSAVLLYQLSYEARSTN